MTLNEAIAAPLPVGVVSVHREYAMNQGRWRLMRDVLEGEDVIKNESTLYLPTPSGMTEPEYNAYLARASFTGYTGRALDAMLGLVGKKTPTFDAPAEIKQLAYDITMTGVTLDSFSLNVLSENLAEGRAGILVDYPVTPEEPLVRVDIEQYGLRPYLSLYKAEDILDWRESRVGNRRILTFLKLRDYYEEPYDNFTYATSIKERVRIFRLSDSGECLYEVYDTSKKANPRGRKSTVELIDEGVIYQKGEPLRYLPFFPVGPMENSMSVQRPPLLDMAFLNIHHYQASADRNHAVHWADVPTPVIIGHIIGADGSSPDSIKLGPTSAINIDSGGDIKFLEMIGHGITPTKELMAEYIEAMSTLGNKILALDSRAAQAAETAAIHRSGEQAILATIANNTSIAITSAIRCMAEFLDIRNTEEISYKLPSNYLPGNIDSQTMIALLGALTATPPKISQKEFFEAMVAGGVIRGDKSYETHLKEIQESDTSTGKSNTDISASVKEKMNPEAVSSGLINTK